MLGHKLVQVLREHAEVWGTLRGGFADVEGFDLFEKQRCVEGIDIENVYSIRKAIDRSQPDVVINAIGIVKQLPSSRAKRLRVQSGRLR